MTEQEKAIELLEKANRILGYYHYHSCEETKDVALMCVDNTIESSISQKDLREIERKGMMLSYNYSKEFWQGVRIHIIEME